jgi:hypothetical protein
VVVNHEDFGYEVIKKGREALGCRLMRGTEEARVAFCFDFIPALEVPGSGSLVGSKEDDGPRLGREDRAQRPTRPA